MARTTAGNPTAAVTSFVGRRREIGQTRLRTLSIGQLLRRLEDRFAVLNIGSRIAAPRQRTLRALVDWSYDLATTEERLLWARLSIFSGNFDLDAAEAVCAGDGITRDRILDLVDQLVTQSVVARREDTRLAMLETIREYGLARLAESGELDALRRLHRTYFLELAERGARHWCGPGQEETLARIRADHGNLRAAFEHFVADPVWAEPAQALCAALRWHWCADGLLSEGRGWLDRALALPSAAGTARANALWVGAWVALLQGDQDVARVRLDECRRVAAAIGDPVPAAYAAGQAGTAELFRGDVDAAVAHFREAIPALQAAGESAGAMHTGFQLAIALTHRGEHDQAAATARHAIDVSEAHGEHLNRSYALWALGFGTWVRGEPAAARKLVLTALTLQRGLRDSVGAALMIETLAWIVGSSGDAVRAARLLGTASSIWRGIGTRIEVFGTQLGEHHAGCVASATRTLRSPRLPGRLRRRCPADGGGGDPVRDRAAGRRGPGTRRRRWPHPPGAGDR